MFNFFFLFKRAFWVTENLRRRVARNNSLPSKNCPPPYPITMSLNTRKLDRSYSCTYRDSSAPTPVAIVMFVGSTFACRCVTTRRRWRRRRRRIHCGNNNETLTRVPIHTCI